MYSGAKNLAKPVGYSIQTFRGLVLNLQNKSDKSQIEILLGMPFPVIPPLSSTLDVSGYRRV